MEYTFFYNDNQCMIYYDGKTTRDTLLSGQTATCPNGIYSEPNDPGTSTPSFGNFVTGLGQCAVFGPYQ